MKTNIKLIAFSAALLAAYLPTTHVGNAMAAPPKQTQEDKDRDARMAEAAKTAKEARERQEMKDTTHDGRYKLGKDTSVGVGGSQSGATLNIRRSTN